MRESAWSSFQIRMIVRAVLPRATTLPETDGRPGARGLPLPVCADLSQAETVWGHLSASGKPPRLCGCLTVANGCSPTHQQMTVTPCPQHAARGRARHGRADAGAGAAGFMVANWPQALYLLAQIAIVFVLLRFECAGGLSAQHGVVDIMLWGGPHALFVWGVVR